MRARLFAFLAMFGFISVSFIYSAPVLADDMPQGEQTMERSDAMSETEQNDNNDEDNDDADNDDGEVDTVTGEDEG